MNTDIEDKCIYIQKIIKGFLCRKHLLPLVMYKIKNILKNTILDLNTSHNDGRINSCFDEQNIISILQKHLNTRVYLPYGKRMWYDISCYDYQVGWIPINIKSSYMNRPDNVGNLSVCFQPLSKRELSLTNNYSNGQLTDMLLYDLYKNILNNSYKKDYYFVVINKNNYSDIIINSVLGLNQIKKNLNNLPFQIQWNKNRMYKPVSIQKRTKEVLECFIDDKKSWKEKLKIESDKLYFKT